MIEQATKPFEAFDALWLSSWALDHRESLMTVDLVTCAYIAVLGLLMMHYVDHGSIRHDRAVTYALKFFCASISIWAFAIVAGYLTGALSFTPPAHVGLNVSLALALTVAVSSRMPVAHPRLRMVYAAVGAVLGAMLTLIALTLPASAVELQCWPAGPTLKALVAIGQEPEATGMVESGPLTIFANRETGAFTIMLHAHERDMDFMCSVASGAGFRVATPKPKGEPS